MEEIRLQARARDSLRKKVRFLRRQALTPANIYGADMSSRAIQVETPVLRKVLARAGRNVLVHVSVDGEASPYTTFIRQTQRHPVTGDILHVDFYRVDLAKPIVSEVPITVTGESPAERLGLGMVIQYLNQVEVECLPTDMPRELTVDVSMLERVDQSLHVRDIPISTAVKILTDLEQLVVRVNPPRAEEEEEKPAAEVVEEEEEEAKAEAEAEPQKEG